jgi:hypothetical protein
MVAESRSLLRRTLERLEKRPAVEPMENGIKHLDVV